MFRIAFDPNTGTFVVQFLRFGLWWQTVKREINDGSVHVCRLFNNYAEARDWVEGIGLNEAFHEQPSKRPPVFTYAA